MSNELFEQWINLGKEASEPAMRFNQLMLRTMEQTGRQQLDAMQSYVELGNRQMKRLSEARTPADWMEAQTSLGNEVTSTMTAQAEHLMELATSTQQELADLAESTIKQAQAQAAAAA